MWSKDKRGEREMANVAPQMDWCGARADPKAREPQSGLTGFPAPVSNSFFFETGSSFLPVALDLG